MANGSSALPYSATHPTPDVALSPQTRVLLALLGAALGPHHFWDGFIALTVKKVTGHALQHQLSPSEKKEIVAELLTGKATNRELAAKYGIGEDTIGHIFKRQMGKSLTAYKWMLEKAVNASRYRAWHTEEKKMYTVLGLDWFNQQVLVTTDGVAVWRKLASFILMDWLGLRDRKRTREYPEGQGIYVGDIIQFPILLRQENGETQETIIKDVVAFDRENGMFIVTGLEEDPLALHNDECEVIGTVYTMFWTVQLGPTGPLVDNQNGTQVI